MDILLNILNKKEITIEIRLPNGLIVQDSTKANNE
jgi:hypothetical protein